MHRYVRFGPEGKPVFYRIPQLAGCLQFIPGAKEVSAPCWAGDVIIFHGLLLHASGPNASPNPRRAYIVTYCAG